MKPNFVQTQEALVEFCEHLGSQELIAFDTEFVAEDSYRPQLCLVQVATATELAIIDPLMCGDLLGFWNLLLDPTKTIVVHAGREESLFCYRATGRLIPGLFDVQVASALLGSEFPASYGNLVQRFVGRQLSKEETRSDWRHRPLSHRQLEYAAQDVRDLPTIHRQIYEELEKQNRTSWLQEEMRERQKHLLESQHQEQWHRLSGAQALTGQSLSIARRLWLWREEQAVRRDIPPRRILRDDLIVELARRGSSDVSHIANLRGMNHRHLKSYQEDLGQCVEQAKDEPVPKWPRKVKYGNRQPSGMLTQFLGAALAFICKTRRISPSLVGTSEDLRDFALYRLENQSASTPPPALLCGWRRDIIGQKLDDLLQGKLGMALDNPLDEMPLRFCSSLPIDEDTKNQS